MSIAPARPTTTAPAVEPRGARRLAENKMDMTIARSSRQADRLPALVGTAGLRRPVVPNYLTVARAEAVFSSDLAAGSDPDRREVTAAIQRARLMCGGSRGCAEVLAGAYGEHPETAAPRMRWALTLVTTIYTPHRTGGGDSPLVRLIRPHPLLRVAGEIDSRARDGDERCPAAGRDDHLACSVQPGAPAAADQLPVSWPDAVQTPATS